MPDDARYEPRKTPTQARAKASVDAILEAAAQLFGDLGFVETNTNLVAERAGVSIGTLYQYFPNKESLMVALHRRYTEYVMETLAERLAGADALSLREACGRLVDTMLEIRAGVRTELYELFSVHLRRLRGIEPMKQSYRHAARLVQGYLERHRESVGPEDLGLAALLAVSTVDRCTEAVMFDNDGTAPAGASEAITELVYGYLRHPDGG